MIKRGRITSLSIKVMWGRRRCTLNSLADKFGKSRKAIYERWCQIKRPGRVYAWLFVSQGEWAKAMKEKGLTGANNPRASRKSFVAPRAPVSLEQKLFPDVGKNCPAYIP